MSNQEKNPKEILSYLFGDMKSPDTNAEDIMNNYAADIDIDIEEKIKDKNYAQFWFDIFNESYQGTQRSSKSEKALSVEAIIAKIDNAYSSHPEQQENIKKLRENLMALAEPRTGNIPAEKLKDMVDEINKFLDLDPMIDHGRKVHIIAGLVCANAEARLNKHNYIFFPKVDKSSDQTSRAILNHNNLCQKACAIGINLYQDQRETKRQLAKTPETPETPNTKTKYTEAGNKVTPPVATPKSDYKLPLPTIDFSDSSFFISTDGSKILGVPESLNPPPSMPTGKKEEQTKALQEPENSTQVCAQGLPSSTDKIQDGKVLKPGSKDSALNPAREDLEARLKALPIVNDYGDGMGLDLKSNLKHLQKVYGLKQDGLAGKDTLLALEVEEARWALLYLSPQNQNDPIEVFNKEGDRCTMTRKDHARQQLDQAIENLENYKLKTLRYEDKFVGRIESLTKAFERALEQNIETIADQGHTMKVLGDTISNLKPKV